MEASPESVRADILDRVKHEGDQGLWETVWGLNTSEPETPLPEKVGIAKEVTLDLLREGRIELWRGIWPDGPIERLGEAEVAALAGDETPWHDPENAALLVWVVQPEDDPGAPSEGA